MTTYELYAKMVVSTTTTVEANSVEEAIDKQYDEGWKGLMFLDHTYPDEGELEIVEVEELA